MDKQSELIRLTTRLVNIPSVVGTYQENDVAGFIFKWLKQVPYYQQHPDHLIKVKIKDDPFQRYNIMALIKKETIKETIFGIGHFDTVAIDDYGFLKDIANDPDKLKVKMQQHASTTICNDAENDDIVFGRGSLDMKSGIAIWMQLIKDISENLDHVKTNLLVGFVCDEEGTSTGMRHMIQPVLAIVKEHDLALLGAIDTDYTTKQYHEDPHRYVYFGTVGKLLVNFVAVGKESHASDPFIGLDANYLIAELIREIDLNPTYTESHQGVTTPVPITLHLENQEKGYSVQTSKISWVYFNVITYQRSINEWMDMFKKTAQIVMDRAIKTINDRYETYCINNGITYEPLPYKTKVMFLEDIKEVNHQNKTIDARINDFLSIQQAIIHQNIDEPCIILYLSMPYYPAHTVTSKDKVFVDRIMTSLSQNSIDDLKILPYYPYISDLSFLRAPVVHDQISIKRHLVDPTQFDDHLWQQIKKLDCPMVNIGPYGYDAHKNTERVHVSSIKWVYDVIMSTIKTIDNN